MFDCFRVSAQRTIICFILTHFDFRFCVIRLPYRSTRESKEVLKGSQQQNVKFGLFGVLVW